MEVLGHQKQLNILNRSMEKNKLSQAYLFVGPSNVGKFLVAQNFAAKLVGGGKIENNPDIIIIKPEGSAEKEAGSTEKKKKTSSKREIKIDQIRELQKKLGLFSQGGKYRVAIIDEAERLNRQAQNGLLKTLEEPNDSSIIILVAKNTEKLLPTIISRCQKIKFGPVAGAEIEEWIKQKNISFSGRKEKERIIFWSLGRPGLILKMADDKTELDFREEALADFEKLLGRNVPEKFSLAEEMAKDRELAVKKMNLWLIILRQTLLGKDVLKISAGKSLEIAERIQKSLEIIQDTNSNTRLILENLFLIF
jgi:DNA polymerase-3 subunit delta'